MRYVYRLGGCRQGGGTARCARDFDVHRRVDPERDRTDELVDEAEFGFDDRDPVGAFLAGLDRFRRDEALDPARCEGLLEHLSRRREAGFDTSVVAAGCDEHDSEERETSKE